MSFKGIQANIWARLIFLIISTVGGAVAWFYNIWELTLVLAIVVTGVAWSVVNRIHKLHHKTRLFFESVKYEDGSLHFNENQKDRNLKELHQNLNRINKIINEIRIREESNERFFKEFMKRSASGLIAVDKDQFVEVVNDSALRIFELINLTHLNRLQNIYPVLYKVLIELETGASESIKLLVESELKQLSIKVAEVQFADKQYRIFSINDIKNEIEENELETWQKLIRIMTHEIMNSIAPITSLSQTLNQYFIKTEKLTEEEVSNTAKGLKVIEERATGLKSFVDSYRKLSKLPQPEFKEIVLKPWLESIQLLFSTQVEEHQIEFSIENTFDKSSFPGDEKLLTHVVLNLLNNSVQALENQGNKKIEIRVQPSHTSSLQLSILDNGKGFKAEELDKIFLPFYTTKENGSGIGLSLSRQIMRMHKGSISAYSELGKGADFVLEF